VSSEITMRVCEVADFGGPEVLREAARPWPRPAPGEVVVSISAANVNPSDVAARAGAHRARMPELRPPFVPGWDLAGIVSEVGDGVSAWAVGDLVVGMIPWIHVTGAVGAYAQAAAVDPGWLAPRPPQLDPITAATVPLNGLTAWQALSLIGAPPGSTLLVTGASGAVGGFAVQLASAAGLRVLAMASDGDKDWVASLGAELVLPRGIDMSTIEPVDALLDAVPIGAVAAGCVREGGVALFTRRVGEIGRTDLRVETPLVHPDPHALAKLAQWVADGHIRTRVARALDLAQGAEAHRLVQDGGLRGKVVLVTG
jgi:NADPH:quinone reductase-like Zn-dependent oxidoreductase